MAVKRLITRRKRVSLRRLLRLQFFSKTTKREKLIFSTLSTTTIVLLAAFTSSKPLWLSLFILGGVAIVTFVIFTLQEDLKGLRYGFIPLLPLLFTLATMLNFSVIPMLSIITFLLVGLFGLSLYLILLIANISAISAERTIPLIRAAKAGSFFFILVTVFLLTFYLATLKIHPAWLFVGVFGLTLLPGSYFVFSLDSKAYDIGRIGVIAVVLALMEGEIAFVTALWPISPLLYALWLTVVFYVCAGVLLQATENRLKRKIIVEYAAVLVFTFILLFLLAQWG